MTWGASAEWSNGSYRYSAGTNPWVLILSVITIGLYFWLMRSTIAEPGVPTTTVFRRYLAFWMDFCFAMLSVAPVVGLIPTIAEWRRTAVFAWTFERTTYAAGDGWVIGVTMLLMFATVIVYFAWPLVLGKPSPGACIAGYQVVPDEGIVMTPLLALGRTALGFVSVAGFFVAPFIARDRKAGKYWLDTVFRTHAIKLK